MGRHGFAGRILRSPANPGWMAGQAPKQVGRVAMDMLPIASKLGDAAVDAAAPMISEGAGQVASAAMPAIASGLGALGSSLSGGALSMIPGAGAILGPLATGAGTLASTLGPAAVSIASKVAPMAAKMLGRGTMAAGAGLSQGVGNLLTGGADQPQTQDAQNFRAMMSSMPSDFGSFGGSKSLPGGDGMGDPKMDVPQEVDMNRPMTPGQTMFPQAGLENLAGPPKPRFDKPYTPAAPMTSREPAPTQKRQLPGVADIGMDKQEPYISHPVNDPPLQPDEAGNAMVGMMGGGGLGSLVRRRLGGFFGGTR